MPGVCPPIYISINLSIRQLEQRGAAARILQILQDTGLDPQYLQLELAENVMVERAEKSTKTLLELKLAGVKLSIDDFGTGYSSLGFLKRFSIDALKIDQSFIRDLTLDPKDEAIAMAVITLAHSLKLRVIAEGVETEEQLAFLRWHHCDELQGALFSFPVTADELTQVLQESRSRSLG